MTRISLALTLLATAATPNAAAASLYDFRMNDIDGKTAPLADYRGKVLLIVNVASRCGYTYQYEGLEALYTRYRDQGLVVLGFPSNDFLGQEPGTNEEIKQFCTLNYGVSFPMFEKITVRGRNTHPLYRYLTERATNPQFSGPVTWNFNKFLVDRTGRIVARFDTRVEPEADELIRAVEAALGS